MIITVDVPYEVYCGLVHLARKNECSVEDEVADILEEATTETEEINDSLVFGAVASALVQDRTLSDIQHISVVVSDAWGPKGLGVPGLDFDSVLAALSNAYMEIEQAMLVVEERDLGQKRRAAKLRSVPKPTSSHPENQPH